MLHGFQEPKNNHDSLAEDLEKQAPKKDDLEVALAPDATGLVHFDQADDKPKSAIPDMTDFADDIEFVQAPEEWTPSGQDGLGDTITSLKDEDEEAAMKE